MSDDDEYDRHVLRDDDDEDTPKKSKKKKKSSSKKSDRSSTSSSGALAGSAAKATGMVKDMIGKIKEAILSVTNTGNVSRKATMVRVLILALLSLIVVMSFMSASLRSPSQEITSPPEIEPEEVIVQKLPGKKSAKLTLAMEKDFGCKELQCIAQCNGKAKPKCLKSKSCVSERDKICRKRCRKTRCEDRCKDEPHLGYVEREQGLEKCKDSCTGPTATHNKCVVKCHVKYKPCKSRCYETASKFQCDNPKFLAMVNPAPAGSSSGGDEDEESSESRGSPDAEDDEEAGDSDAPPPKKKSSGSSSRGGGGGGLEDDDLI